MSSILFKAEDAMESYLNGTTGLESISGFYRGSDNQEYKLPFISILAENGEERNPRGSGNYSVILNVELHTSVDDVNRTDRITLTETLLDKLCVTDLADQMSLADNFHVHGIVFNTQSQRISNRSHAYIVSIRVDCRNADPS